MVEPVCAGYRGFLISIETFVRKGYDLGEDEILESHQSSQTECDGKVGSRCAGGLGNTGRAAIRST